MANMIRRGLWSDDHFPAVDPLWPDLRSTTLGGPSALPTPGRLALKTSRPSPRRDFGVLMEPRRDGATAMMR
jgi:hypothetical protein